MNFLHLKFFSRIIFTLITRWQPGKCSELRFKHASHAWHLMIFDRTVYYADLVSGHGPQNISVMWSPSVLEPLFCPDSCGVLELEKCEDAVELNTAVSFNRGFIISFFSSSTLQHHKTEILCLLIVSTNIFL